MLTKTEIRERITRIATLARDVDTIADKPVRDSVLELIRSLMEFHGTALERVLEIVAEAGDPGLKIVDQLGRDDLSAGLLLLYGLHPLSLEERVRQALQTVRPYLRNQGGSVELLGVDEGAIRLRLVVTGNGGSSLGALKASVEEAVYDAAPEAGTVEIERLEHPDPSAFVPLEMLRFNTLDPEHETSPREF